VVATGGHPGVGTVERLVHAAPISPAQNCDWRHLAATPSAPEPADAMGRQRHEIARELATDIDRYNVLLDASKQRINTALAASATTLTTISGVGPICAAMIIGESGNIERFKSKHHFASYNATAPVEASSGPKVRHRLNQRVTGS
jgi:transposase